jgi:hypothetical protein
MSDKKTVENEEIWETEDGTQIPIAELSEEHAKNILRMIIRVTREKRMFVEQMLVPALIEHIREEFGADVQIDNMSIDGEPLTPQPEAEVNAVDAAFIKAGAGGNNIH